MKGCLGDSREGDNSGQTQSDLDARFLPLSLSISMRRKVIACSGSCEAIVYTWVSMIKGPRTLVDNIQKLISATPRGSKVKGMPQDHSQSPQTTKISRANLSPSLSNSTMFYVLQSIPTSYYLHHQQHQLPSANSSLHSQGEGTTLRVRSQTAACRNPFGYAGRRAPSGGHVAALQMLLSSVTGQVTPTKPIT